MYKILKYKNEIIVFSLSIFVTIFIYTFQDFSFGNKFIFKTQEVDKKLDISKEIILSEPKVVASSAIIYDINKKKIIYEKNPNQKRPIASLTKVVSMIVASDIGDKNKKIEIPDWMITERINNNEDVIPGERWSLKNLLKYTLLSSSNIGAASIALSINQDLKKSESGDSTNLDFVSQMNLKVKNLGLESLQFFNASGLDESSTQAGGYGSAKDLSLLATYAVENYYSLFEDTNRNEVDINSLENAHRIYNTNFIADKIPGLVFSKTGNTKLANGSLAVVFDAGLNQPIAVVVLGSGKESRFKDVEKLVSYAQNYYLSK